MSFCAICNKRSLFLWCQGCAGKYVGRLHNVQTSISVLAHRLLNEMGSRLQHPCYQKMREASRKDMEVKILQEKIAKVKGEIKFKREKLEKTKKTVENRKRLISESRMQVESSMLDVHKHEIEANLRKIEDFKEMLKKYLKYHLAKNVFPLLSQVDIEIGKYFAFQEYEVPKEVDEYVLIVDPYAFLWKTSYTI